MDQVFNQPVILMRALLHNKTSCANSLLLKKNAFAIHWRYEFSVAILVYAQFAAVGGHPIFVEVHHHRILPATIIFKLIKVLFVKTAWLIQCIMKLVTCYPGKAGAVQMRHKAVHQVKKNIFGGVIMQAVQPVNLVATHCVVQ